MLNWNALWTVESETAIFIVDLYIRMSSEYQVFVIHIVLNVDNH